MSGSSSAGAGMSPSSQASLLLKKQLAELNKNPVEGFSAGLIDDNDIFKWEVKENYPISFRSFFFREILRRLFFKNKLKQLIGVRRFSAISYAVTNLIINAEPSFFHGP